MGGAYSDACERWEIRRKLWSKDVKGETIQRPRRRWNSIKSALEIWRKSVGFIWLRTDAIYGLLWALWWTFEFHKAQWILWLAEIMFGFSTRAVPYSWCACTHARAHAHTRVPPFEPRKLSPLSNADIHTHTSTMCPRLDSDVVFTRQ